MRALLRIVPLAVALLVLCAPALARADTTIDFEQPGPETTITNQYADIGGPGQGVVFGPLPGGRDGLRPVIKNVGMGVANSGVQVADIATCSGCEQFHANTVGTFNVARSTVSVHVGYEGTKPKGRPCSFDPSQSYCAIVTLTAYDSDGNPIGTPSSATVTRGNGFHTLLSVSTQSAQIIGFRITSREDASDNNKPIAIDDLSYDVPATPPPPDFTVTPANTNAVMGQGETLNDAISIGRLSGSSGPVQLSLSGQLPTGVTASFAPNPADGTQSILTFTSAPDSGTTGFNPTALTVTATPADASAGASPHSATINLQVRSAFDVSVQNGQTDVNLSSCSVDVPIEVDRAPTFAGPVALSVAGLPRGVQASFSPSQATFPNGAFGQVVTLTLRAPPTGAALLQQTATVTGSAPPLGSHAVAITVHGTCPAQYDARVTSMQITQGVQTGFLPIRDPAAHPPNLFNYGQIPNAAKLRGGGPTVVRVYADEAFGPTTGVPGVPALLYGSSEDQNGHLHALPGSPIAPVSGTRNLAPGPETATTIEEDSETGAYSFQLPAQWTHGVIALNAILQPTTGVVNHTVARQQTSGAFGQALTPCTTDTCVSNDAFGLTNIPFVEAPPVTIRPVQLTVAGKPPLPDPQSVFAYTRLVTPLDVQVEPYAGTVEITDIADALTVCNAAAGMDQDKRSQCSDDANSAGAERMDDWTCDNDEPDNGWNIGVNTGVSRGLTKTDYCVFEAKAPDNAVIEVKRPLTSATHEFFHLLGRQHASYACGGGSNGQTAVDWPPDQVGYIQGVGLDTALGSGINGGPFAIIDGAPPRTADCNSDPGAGDCTGPMPAQWLDFMSYCASDSLTPLTKGDAWISLRNWNEVFADHSSQKPAVERRATGPPGLQVTASAMPDGSVSITSVAQLPAESLPASGSPYHLVGTDATGQVLADVAMITPSLHVDGVQPPLSLVGAIPRASVVKLAIVKDGVTLASRSKSAHAPTVALKGRPVVHGGTATVRWKSGDADGEKLMADVDYSANGGKSYRRVLVGPDKGSAKLPARYFARAARARVRVTVNDSFNATSARSAVFRSPGAPPVVAITSPARGMREPNDAPLVLSGQAFDDKGTMLTGKRLRWLAGRRVLGTGRSISATGLTPGRRTITLVARDHFGRTGRRSVKVAITGARPLFLVLKAPATIKRKARSVRLKVASTLPGRLVVRGQRFKVSRKPRSLKVRIAPGSGRLTLRLRLASGHEATTRNVLIRRR
jgi:hypothetical protein